MIYLYTYYTSLTPLYFLVVVKDYLNLEHIQP